MKAFTGNRRGAGLGTALVCVAQFVVVLDVTIVTTSLPVVRQSLGFSAAGLTWVITAYTLVFGGFLIPGGRLADLVGARRVFVLGIVGFSVASGACALAGSPAMLVGARAVQGLGAAMLSPAAFALLDRIGPEADFVKVGLQLFVAEGPAMVRELLQVHAGAARAFAG